MSLSAWNEQKRKLVLQLLDHGMVMIHLDPRATGVVVPPRFRNDPTLRLNLAYGFNLPALDVAEEGIYAVLSFGGVDSSCSLPWEAVYAATLPDEDHRGMMWAGSLPPEGDALFGLPPRDVPANAAPGAAAAPDPAERVRPTLAESSTHHRRSGADSRLAAPSA